MICTGLDDKLNLIDIYLSQTDIKERLLDKLQRVSLVCRVFKSISEHISKAKPLWTNFFKAMSCKTVRLPEPYDNYNKLFVFYFICLLKPALV